MRSGCRSELLHLDRMTRPLGLVVLSRVPTWVLHDPAETPTRLFEKIHQKPRSRRTAVDQDRTGTRLPIQARVADMRSRVLTARRSSNLITRSRRARIGLAGSGSEWVG